MGRRGWSGKEGAAAWEWSILLVYAKFPREYRRWVEEHEKLNVFDLQEWQWSSFTTGGGHIKRFLVHLCSIFSYRVTVAILSDLKILGRISLCLISFFTIIATIPFRKIYIHICAHHTIIDGIQLCLKFQFPRIRAHQKSTDTEFSLLLCSLFLWILSRRPSIIRCPVSFKQWNLISFIFQI